MPSHTKMVTPITLYPATPADIPTLSTISSLAFKTDTHTRLKELIRGDDFAEGTKSHLEGLLSASPGRCSVLKAVAEDGQAVGWACWGFRGLDGPIAETIAAPEPSIDGREEQQKEGSKAEEGSASADEKEQDTAKTKIAELEALTDTSMASWMAKLMPEGTKCMYIISICIHPSHQGQGIGRSLIQWGTSLADEKGVFCWVHSSDGGWKVFEKEGFGEVGRLEVELDEFACGIENEEGDGGRWGSYVWRYMRRPEALS